MKTIQSIFYETILTTICESKWSYPILFIMIISILSQCSHADDRKFTLNNTQYMQLTSSLTNRDHELIVFLPDSYETMTEKRYPVLYFMDAYWDMPLLASIHGQLVYDNVLPELIMVGFSYPGDNVNYGDLRARDLAPVRDAHSNPFSGDGPKFLQFIEETVIPKIESKYRADPTERALSGSSLGGLFTLYAMYEKPTLFKRFISISPATVWDNGFLFSLDDSYAQRSDTLAVRLFLSYGSGEYAPFRDPIIKFQNKIAEQDYKGLALLNYAILEERHSGVKSEGYSRGLRWVFKDIAPTGPSGLEREFRNEP